MSQLKGNTSLKLSKREAERRSAESDRELVDLCERSFKRLGEIMKRAWKSVETDDPNVKIDLTDAEFEIGRMRDLIRDRNRENPTTRKREAELRAFETLKEIYDISTKKDYTLKSKVQLAEVKSKFALQRLGIDLKGD